MTQVTSMFTNTDTISRYLGTSRFIITTDAAASTVPTVLIDVHHPPPPTPA